MYSCYNNYYDNKNVILMVRPWLYNSHDCVAPCVVTVGTARVWALEEKMFSRSLDFVLLATYKLLYVISSGVVVF